ncbi:MAG: hypothetical protein RLP44_21915 [Aggregatilineales bacterium]
MHLTPQEVERFYGIWFPLLHFVNEQKNLIPSFPSKWKESPATPEMALPLRNALWEDDKLREEFISKNPAKLSDADLALVKSWDHRISENMFIFRNLKNYTILIPENRSPVAYGVIGIMDGFDEMFGDNLPIYAEIILIPFEDRIIYDSLMMPYPIFFGGGIKSSLKDAYNEVQERGGVVTSLPVNQPFDKETVQRGNSRTLKAFQKALGASSLSPKKMQEHLDVITKFSDDFMLQQDAPQFLLDLNSHHIENYVYGQRGINKVSFKRFVRFLRDTDRMDWDLADELLKFLK